MSEKAYRSKRKCPGCGDFLYSVPGQKHDCGED